MTVYKLQEKQYVFYEGDDITSIYFKQSGSCGFVLPKHNNLKYINIDDGMHFGIIDIIASLLENEMVLAEVIDDWITRKEILKRQFTVMADKETSLLTLSVQNLDRMKFEFLETYE